MIQVRSGIFETNSSSIHAISVCTDPPGQIPDHIDLQMSEYGWERRTISLPNYIFTACAQMNRVEELAAMLDHIGVSYTMLPSPDTIRKECEEYGYLSYRFGGIDHYDDLKPFIDAIMSDENLFKCAMFNSASQVETGNDNVYEDEEIPSPIVGERWYSYEKGN